MKKTIGMQEGKDASVVPSHGPKHSTVPSAHCTTPYFQPKASGTPATHMGSQATDCPLLPL